MIMPGRTVRRSTGADKEHAYKTPGFYLGRPIKWLLALEDGSEGEKDSAYVQLSNIYLAANKYDDARRIRRMIGDKGVKKTPGFSTVEVDGEVNTFYAGVVKHKRLSEIHSLLDLVAIDGLGDYDDSVLEGIDVLDNIASKNEVMQPVR